MTLLAAANAKIKFLEKKNELLKAENMDLASQVKEWTKKYTKKSKELNQETKEYRNQIKDMYEAFKEEKNNNNNNNNGRPPRP